jgi:nucleoside-diphosphate-sugar epimerase
MARILITGGAGYIGAVLTPILLARGHHVTVMDRFDVHGHGLAQCCGFEGFTPVKGDVRDGALLDRLTAQHDVIIPLAALVGAPICAQDPAGAEAVNRDAVVRIVKAASRDQMVLYPTTNSGYGVGAADAFCTEESPLKPISVYGVTKVQAEEAVLQANAGVTFRLATVFGMSPKMRVDLLVNDFTLRAVRDRAVVIFEGHFRRNYIHIRDVAGAFMHAMDNYATMRGQAYNVGLSEANLSKLELCARIKHHIPGFVYLEAPIGEDPDKRDYIVSNEKLERTGWRPEWGLDRGIEELIKGYTMLRVMNFTNV